jgi:threonine aldolase
MARLAAGLGDLGVDLERHPRVNMAYALIDEATIGRLEQRGLLFYRMGPGRIRLVTSFGTGEQEVDEILRRFASALPAEG